MALKTVINRRHETSQYENYDAEVVQLATKRSAGLGVVGEKMAGGRETEACCRREKETREGVHICSCGGGITGDKGVVELKPREQESDCAEQVGPYINLFCDPSDRYVARRGEAANRIHCASTTEILPTF